MHGKVLVLILAEILLAFGAQAVSYSQSSSETNVTAEANEFLDALLDVQTSLPLEAKEIRKKVLPSVVFIKVVDIDTKKSWTGSGVLINKDQRLVLTNAHVTNGEDKVGVFFPAYDLRGVLIQEKDFYLDWSNGNVLEKFGYVTNGRVVAEDSKADVAIVSLEGLPKTTEQIESDRDYDYSLMKPGDPVHFLGNPGNRDLLWQWDPGHFQKYDGKTLSIDGRAWFGNSGGPVVDKMGMLIGLVQSIADQRITYAVPIPPIVDLVEKLKPVYILSIENKTEFTVDYEIRWFESSDWKKYSLKPDDVPKIHKENIETILHKDWGNGYPKIRYVDVPAAIDEAPSEDDPPGPDVPTVAVDDMLPKDTPPGVATVPDTPSENMPNGTERIYQLKVEFQYFNPDDNQRIKTEDSYRYRFEYDPQQEKLYLREPKQTFWVANNTEYPVDYTVWWVSSPEIIRQNSEWHSLNPGKKRPHWWPGFSKDIPTGYPKVRFSLENTDNDDFDLETFNVISIQGIGSRIVKTKEEFFSVDVKESDLITNAKEQNRTKHDNYYYFDFGPMSRVEGEGEILKLYSGLPKPKPIPRKGIQAFIKNNSIPIFVVELVLIAAFFIWLTVKKYFPRYRIYSIQNNTEATVEYQVQWIESKEWETDSLEVDEEWTGWSLESSKEGYPKVRFNSIINDKKETQEQVLGIYTRRFRRKDEERINREHARKYHFEQDTETKALKLVDSEADD